MKDTESKKAIIAILEAAAAGKVIQYDYDDKGWAEIDPFRFLSNLSEYAHKYRVKPNPVIVSWTFENAPIAMKVRHKGTGQVYRAEPLPDEVCLLVKPRSPNWRCVSYATFCLQYEQLDGSPCGTVEEKQ